MINHVHATVDGELVRFRYAGSLAITCPDRLTRDDDTRWRVDIRNRTGQLATTILDGSRFESGAELDGFSNNERAP